MGPGIKIDPRSSSAEAGGAESMSSRHHAAKARSRSTRSAIASRARPSAVLLDFRGPERRARPPSCATEFRKAGVEYRS